MFMNLLDVLPDPRIPKVRRIEPDMDDSMKAAQKTVDVVKEKVMDVKDSVADAVDATCDTITETVSDTLAETASDTVTQAQPLMDGTVQAVPSQLWHIIVVAAALAICILFAILYRKRSKGA